MADSRTSAQRAIILTALRVEYIAVRAHLRDIDEIVHPQGTVYERGIFSSPRGQWEIILVQTGMGGTSAAVEAERAIEYFHPDHIFFVGVAGGLKDVKLGDVVAATKVYGYESGKADVKFFPRPEVGQSTYRMEQRAQSEARKLDWLQRIIGSVPSPTPDVIVAPIAAGSQVLKSTQSSLAKFLQTNYGDAVAVEMEGHGILKAAHANAPVEALIIRGISDLIDNKTEVDAQGWQGIAARTASAFAFEMLAKLAVAQPAQSQSSQAPSTPPRPATPVANSASGQTPGAFEVFYSYAEEDESYAKRLQQHLVLLKRQNLITDWYAEKVKVGETKSEEVMRHLNTAPIILLLISTSYLASDHYSELELAMERQKAHEARVIPILIHPIEKGWEKTPVLQLQAIPRNGKAIAQWKNIDEAFVAVAADIRAVVEDMKNGH